MIEYKCPRCFMVTYQKNNMRRHINNLKMCIINKEGFDVNLHDYKNVLLGNIDPVEYIKATICVKIDIRPYNNPYTDYILHSHCDEILQSVDLMDICMQTFRLVWVNPDHKENHNIYKSNKKDKTVKCVVNNGNIKECEIFEISNAIMDVISTVLERNEISSDKHYDITDIYYNPLDHTKFYKTLDTNICNELYNNRYMIKTTFGQMI